MPVKELTWDDPDRIAFALCREHPEIDPENIALRDLHRLTTQLKDFKGDPQNFNELKLEAIRSAWNMEFLDRTQ